MTEFGKKRENAKSDKTNIHSGKQGHKTLYNNQQKKELLLWFASTSEKLQLAVMNRINPAPYKSFLTKDEARMQALLQAADIVRSAQVLTGRKSPEQDLAAHDAAHMLRVEIVRSMRGRKSPKKEKVWMHTELIQKLFADGLSLRQVCVYLRQYAGLNINHSYLRKCCIELGLPVPPKGKLNRTGDDTCAG